MYMHKKGNQIVFPPEYKIEFADATVLICCEQSLSLALLYAEKRQQQLQRSTKIHKVFTRVDTLDDWHPVPQPK